MNEIDLYQQILHYRNLLKTIQQFSWEVSQIDRQYPLGEIKPNQYQALLTAYKNCSLRAKKIIELLDEASDEQLETTNPN